MKQVLKFLLIIFVPVNTFSCKAQLVQTVSDVKKLEINKDKFIGRPLKDLLAQIKPPIRRMRAMPGGGELTSRIFFNFVSDSTYDTIVNRTGRSPVLLEVQVKENFEWNPFKTKPAGHRFDWTKEDEEKYGKLTVINVRVSGVN